MAKNINDQPSLWEPIARDYLPIRPPREDRIMAVPSPTPAYDNLPPINGDYLGLSIGLFVLLIGIWLMPTIPEDED